MKKVCVLAGIMMAFCSAQIEAQLHYDLYYGLPGSAGSKTLDAGLFTGDIGAIADGSDVPVMAKYSLSDKLEVGARITLGVLNENADALNTVVVGAKQGLGENSAVSVNLLAPIGGAEDPGLALGYMMSTTCPITGLTLNNHLQLGLLKGHAPKGIGIDLLIEPVKPLGEKMVGYLDILVATNTDDIGGAPLAINLGPNVDFMLNETTAINAGVVIGLAGDSKASEIGLGIAAIKGL